MSLESSEKQTGRSVPLTASQQAAAAKNAATAEKVRNVVAKTTEGTAKPSKSVETKSVDSRANTPAETAPSKSNASAVAEPPEPVEDKAAAKARAKQEKAEAKARAKAEKAELKKAAKAERNRVASGGGIKDVFVLHVEKIVLGICVLAALGIIYAGIGSLSLAPNQHPTDMSKELDGIDARIKNPSFQSKEFEFTMPVYDGSVGRFKVPIRPASVVMSVPSNPILVPPQKRGGPELYAPGQLLATAGDGVFLVTQLKPRQKKQDEVAARAPAPPGGGGALGAAVVAPGAGGGAAAPADEGDAAQLLRKIGDGDPAPGPAAIPDGQPLPIPNNVLPNSGVAPPAGNGEQRVFPEARRWISIVGLLPIMQQQAAFDKEFANAFDHDPDRDQPIYAEVRFLRLEVPPGTSESQLDWSKAKEWTWKEQLAMNKAEQRVWVLTPREVVPQKFIRNDAPKMPDNLKNAGLGVISKLLGPLVNQPWEPWASHPRLYEAPVIEEPVQDAVKEEEEAKPGAAAPIAPQQQDPDDPFGLKKPVVVPDPKKEAVAKMKAVPKPRAQEANQVEYQLVRLFDFTVEPGKQYRYKLQLMMRNPNFQIPARNLQDPKLASDPWLMTAWSDASNTVAVPDGQSVLADTVVRPSAPAPAAAGAPRPNAATAASEVAEATARVVVKILNFDAAQETFAILNLRRGALAAGSARQIILNPLRREVAQKSNANIRTDLVLADFRGGEKLEEGLEAPAEMLFIDTAGQLVAQNSVQDETWVKAVHELMKLFDAPAPTPMAKAGEAADTQKDIKASQENAKGPKPPRRNK